LPKILWLKDQTKIQMLKFAKSDRAELKTAAQWYARDDTCDILDPDGWDRSPNGSKIWWTQKITEAEYQTRRFKCTICEYNNKYSKHKQPFEPRL